MSARDSSENYDEHSVKDNGSFSSGVGLNPFIPYSPLVAPLASIDLMFLAAKDGDDAEEKRLINMLSARASLLASNFSALIQISSILLAIFGIFIFGQSLPLIPSLLAYFGGGFTVVALFFFIFGLSFRVFKNFDSNSKYLEELVKTDKIKFGQYKTGWRLLLTGQVLFALLVLSYPMIALFNLIKDFL